MSMLATEKDMEGVGDDFVCDEGLRKEGRMRSGTGARGQNGITMLQRAESNCAEREGYRLFNRVEQADGDRIQYWRW